MSNSLTTRRLKVAPYYVHLHHSLKFTSSLRLADDWLLYAGFQQGDVAAVEVHEGCLTITRGK